LRFMKNNNVKGLKTLNFIFILACSCSSKDHLSFSI
jgi:hypothetical protein